MKNVTKFHSISTFATADLKSSKHLLIVLIIITAVITSNLTTGDKFRNK